ncbi:bifunctional 3-demethylubiquinol 3-O-methyltransferase/2-polyprenyl-6-hydroxyphenol methylase [Psychromonas sp. psych-6C06]|uniref:bifunctional 2-polyprenyl-6-hydroxyphenol methylase/3-demethylubiquinol 3-O-methyltransferase UbiG n=1 Tax=Psychromonas sp. psych-6C06 TaxID=2058089 RepID=UPI000C344418|nr:bifunctional 2-polyprenyl-6-hydroxyphenol methylase/3-demethylubiquinol 3-O-methyltransferase UbiG [Psychromonas sp. psych-6C06]PKF63664.1 bifunctional 3-demethylubiquinol 3-O-methyltransferase/2-polyprenyl-6-hydroxyphenol methylase [Psychromonas sp. psych-6C06]
MRDIETNINVDESEIKKFEAMADQWWDPNGKFKPLHMLNPTRLAYIIEQISSHFQLSSHLSTPFDGLSLLDIGCGGGLLSEPMAKLGAQVIGVDATAKNIPVAQYHAQQSGLEIDYRHGFATTLIEEERRFDVILNMEVVEHVQDPKMLLAECASLLKPGGLLICSTINRNSRSYLIAIIGTERVMRWLPVGTHQWKKFITPRELKLKIESAGLTNINCKGFVFNPLLWKWSISNRNLSVNYVTASTKSQ